MGRWEHRYLGWDRFPDPSTPIEIEQLFTLESDELACAKARRTPLHRLWSGRVDVGQIYASGSSASSASAFLMMRFPPCSASRSSTTSSLLLSFTVPLTVISCSGKPIPLN